MYSKTLKDISIFFFLKMLLTHQDLSFVGYTYKIFMLPNGCTILTMQRGVHHQAGHLPTLPTVMDVITV
ncbi:hypothetical protein O6P43_002718 [Quillaja saponaria]|uniref:Uncharacterized protein n=1 Tax=Quillaja saponaria TaxID=32244 RepID=A0AAD7QDH2_QUISA|nr:hypothetical protein O6P43_002718 [Quillaja saponaria]